MKYKLTDETIELCGRTLHRIECVEAFADVKVGDKGGYIETENNLSQLNGAWVYGDTWVFGGARVYGNARVYGGAQVYGNAEVYDGARVYGNAVVYDDAWVHDDARVYDGARVCGNARVSGNARVCGNARVRDNAWVRGNAEVCGDAEVCGNARVCDDADYIVFKNKWSSGRYFTWTRSNDMWTVGCFHGTGEKLIKKAYAESENSGKHYEAYVRFVEQLKELDKK